MEKGKRLDLEEVPSYEILYMSKNLGHISSMGVLCRQSFPILAVASKIATRVLLLIINA